MLSRSFAGCQWLDREERRSPFDRQLVRDDPLECSLIWKKSMFESPSGMIEPYQTIDCEVVWYGSTQAPLDNFFTLHVFSTNDSRKISESQNGPLANHETTLSLQCIAQVGKAKFKIPEKRVNFGSIPINMTSKKSFTIVNEGTNHLFYQVCLVHLLRARARNRSSRLDR